MKGLIEFLTLTLFLGHSVIITSFVEIKELIQHLPNQEAQYHTDYVVKLTSS